MITAQHGDGEPDQSGLGDRVAMEYGGGGPDDEAIQQAKWDNCKRICKKRLVCKRRLIVQPAYGVQVATSVDFKGFRLLFRLKGCT